MDVPGCWEVVTHLVVGSDACRVDMPLWFYAVAFAPATLMIGNALIDKWRRTH